MKNRRFLILPYHLCKSFIIIFQWSNVLNSFNKRNWGDMAWLTWGKGRKHLCHHDLNESHGWKDDIKLKHDLVLFTKWPALRKVALQRQPDQSWLNTSLTFSPLVTFTVKNLLRNYSFSVQELSKSKQVKNRIIIVEQLRKKWVGCNEDILAF